MIFAHGVGSRGDLPLPLWMFTWTAAFALAISFIALGMLWPRPRLAVAAAGSELPGAKNESLFSAARGVGRSAALALFFVALWAGLFGEDSSARNLLPVTLYVIVWVGAQLCAGLIGDVWRVVSPLNTLADGVEHLTKRAGRTVKRPPESLGQWPAVAGLFAFLFVELAHPSGDSPRVLAWLLLAHTLVVLALAVRFGARWVADHEPFAALFSMLAAMAPLAVQQGRLRFRAPMSGLAVMPVVPGTLAALLIVLGGTTFDGFAESEVGREVLGRPEGWSGSLLLTLGLLASIALVSLLFFVGVGSTAKVTGNDPKETARAFTPSLVPIVFGYAIAHYAQLLVDETQTFVFRLSDPAGLGWNLFGGADASINFNLISVNLIAWIQVLAILFGHIGAVIVAHDRALEVSPRGQSSKSQYAMLFVMVLYSTLGLALLFNA